MGLAFDQALGRPEHIDAILNGLERYNPETTTVFQDYVTQQCEERTYDCYANLALLKLYQFNPHLLHPDTTTAILVKALTVFPAPDFSLCLHLLPAHTLQSGSTSNSNGNGTATIDSDPLPSQANAQQSSQSQQGHPQPLDPLSEAVQKLSTLNSLLESAQYAHFWTTLDSDDLYADLVADVSGFEELMRVRIAVTVGQGCREISRRVLEGWLGMEGRASGANGGGTGGNAGAGAGAEFEGFVRGVCGWKIEEGDRVLVPVNKENEAKGTVVREEVKFDQFARVVKRAYEQPA